MCLLFFFKDFGVFPSYRGWRWKFQVWLIGMLLAFNDVLWWLSFVGDDVRRGTTGGQVCKWLVAKKIQQDQDKAFLAHAWRPDDVLSLKDRRKFKPYHFKRCSYQNLASSRPRLLLLIMLSVFEQICSRWWRVENNRFGWKWFRSFFCVI